MENDFGAGLAGWLGKFHPLLVHSPIGILLLGALMLFLVRWSRFSPLKASLPLVFLLGGIGAVFSCITGWMLASTGEYDPQTADWHRWSGIGVAVVGLGSWAVLRFREGKSREKAIQLVISVLTVAGVSMAGHLGGTLTHGEGYLNWSAESDGKTAATTGAIADIQQAGAYQAVIKPILEKKCVSCHGSGKQKGKLRMDTPEYLLAGGKGGEVLLAGDAAGSTLMQRVLLDPLEKKHMPPKGRTPLTQNEITLLRWWIDAGADFEKKVSALPQTAAITTLLKTLESANKPASPSDWPDEPVAAAPETALKALRSLGVVVLPIEQNSHYLQASFVAVPSAGDSVVALLAPLSDQLVALKLGNTRITDKGVASLAGLRALRRLSLENTAVTDKGLASISGLKALRVLNLVGTRISAQGLLTLKALPHLEQVFLYQTPIQPADWPGLVAAFPRTLLDSGGYQVPTFEADTTEWKIKR